MDGGYRVRRRRRGRANGLLSQFCQLAQPDRAWLAEVLHIPPVLVFTGHEVDPAGRPGLRFAADAVRYSRLSEDQIPRWVEHLLGAVAELNRRTQHRCEHVETAGDGLYLVFAEVTDAARYALELSALVAGTDWAACGLPAEFGLPVAAALGDSGIVMRHVGRIPLAKRAGSLSLYHLQPGS